MCVCVHIHIYICIYIYIYIHIHTYMPISLNSSSFSMKCMPTWCCSVAVNYRFRFRLKPPLPRPSRRLRLSGTPRLLLRAELIEIRWLIFFCRVLVAEVVVFRKVRTVFATAPLCFSSLPLRDAPSRAPRSSRALHVSACTAYTFKCIKLLNIKLQSIMLNTYKYKCLS